MSRKVQALGTGLALITAGVWLGAAALHPTFRRQQASEILAQTLPPGSVVIGEAAPSLCMGTRLRAAPVQFGLSNTVDPLAQTGASYIITGREPVWTAFWARTAPGIVVPAKSITTVTLPSERNMDVFRVR